jgi:hypothetical protein
MSGDPEWFGSQDFCLRGCKDDPVQRFRDAAGERDMILPSFKPMVYVDMAVRLRCDALLIERDLAQVDPKDGVAKGTIVVNARTLRAAADVYDSLVKV